MAHDKFAAAFWDRQKFTSALGTDYESRVADVLMDFHSLLDSAYSKMSQWIYPTSKRGVFPLLPSTKHLKELKPSLAVPVDRHFA